MSTFTGANPIMPAGIKTKREVYHFMTPLFFKDFSCLLIDVITYFFVVVKVMKYG